MFLIRDLLVIIKRITFYYNRDFLFSLVRILKLPIDSERLQDHNWSLAALKIDFPCLSLVKLQYAPQFLH